LNDFNLIASTYRFREEEAQDEILDTLESFGDADAVCEITEIKGILLAQSAIDPITVVGKLKQIASTEPWQIRYILRVLPVSRVVPTKIDDISGAVSEISSIIRPEDKFRITVEKRHTSLESLEVIKALASRIDRIVDLDRPDWVVLVQILGSQTGVSIVRPDQIFSSVVEKRR
jgi:tRNA acetyltransferase TAN1